MVIVNTILFKVSVQCSAEAVSLYLLPYSYPLDNGDILFYICPPDPAQNNLNILHNETTTTISTTRLNCKRCKRYNRYIYFY